MTGLVGFCSFSDRRLYLSRFTVSRLFCICDFKFASAIVATDLNQPMVDHAAAIGTVRPVEWRQADAMQLPFAAESFDAVVCQFGAMFFPDKPRAYAEVRRVLKPDGSALIDDLRGDAPKESVREWVSGHESRFMRWGAKHSFSEAYTARDIEGILEDSAFEDFDVRGGEVNVEIWLRK